MRKARVYKVGEDWEVSIFKTENPRDVYLADLKADNWEEAYLNAFYMIRDIHDMKAWTLSAINRLRGRRFERGMYGW